MNEFARFEKTQLNERMKHIHVVIAGFVIQHPNATKDSLQELYDELTHAEDDEIERRTHEASRELAKTPEPDRIEALDKASKLF